MGLVGQLSLVVMDVQQVLVSDGTLTLSAVSMGK